MSTSEKILTFDEAYDATVDYLDKYYNKTHSIDICDLVSWMQLLIDGGSYDPASLEDWKDSVNKTLNLKPQDSSFLKINDSKRNNTVETL